MSTLFAKLARALRFTDAQTTAPVAAIPQYPEPVVAPVPAKPLTLREVKRAVLFMLRNAAESVVDVPRPDVFFDVVPSKQYMQDLRWQAKYADRIAEAEPEMQAAYTTAATEYRNAVKAEMRAQWQDITRHGMDRLYSALGSYSLPRSVGGWAHRQYERLLERPNHWALAYTLLVVRDAVEWEWTKLGPTQPRDALGMLQAEYVRTKCTDDGRVVTWMDEEGELVTVKNVADGTSRGALDIRGLDRPSSYAVRGSGSKKKADRWAIEYSDTRTGELFDRTNTGWYYRQQRVSTSVAQRLDERVASKRLARTDGKDTKPRAKVTVVVKPRPVSPDALALIGKAVAVKDYGVFTPDQLKALAAKLEAAFDAAGDELPHGALAARKRLRSALAAAAPDKVRKGPKAKPKARTPLVNTELLKVRTVRGICPQASVDVPEHVAQFGNVTYVVPPLAIGDRNLAHRERLAAAVLAVS